MSDGRRISSRGNKGQHTKNIPTSETPEPNRPKAKSKAAKKAAAEADNDGAVRCVCGLLEEDDDEAGRSYVACDKCGSWQHTDCMGLGKSVYQKETYLCEQCNPDGHTDLLAALDAGEKAWAAFVKKRNDEVKRANMSKVSKKGKLSRQSQSADLKSEGSDENGNRGLSEPQSEGVKRKYQSGEVVNGETQPTKARRTSGQTAGGSKEGNAKKRKTAQSSNADLTSNAPVKTINDLPHTAREQCASKLWSALSQQIAEGSKSGLYDIYGSSDIESTAEHLAISIEHALNLNYAGEVHDYGTNYAAKFRQIHSNLKKNSSLIVKLLDGTLSADELSKMTPEQMASEEHQRKLAQMRQEAEQESVLIQPENGPRIRRTHKGDELVGDENTHVAIEPTLPPPVPRRRESAMADGDTVTQSPGASHDQPRAASMDVSNMMVDSTHSQGVIPPSQQTPDGSSDKRPSNFNIGNVWDNVQTNRASIDGQQHDLLVPATGSSHAHHEHEPDPDIDRLLHDPENEYVADASAGHNLGSGAVWHGFVEIPNGNDQRKTTFSATAHHVAGSNLAARLPLGSIFPEQGHPLVLAGRIRPDLADNYVSGLASATNTDVTVLSLTSPSTTSGADEFNEFFSYLHSRGRYGVVGKYNKEFIRDIYIVPLEQGAEEMPKFLQRLDNNVIEQPRPRRLLLLTFVFKWPGEQSPATNTPGQQADAHNVTAFPTKSPGAVMMSPVPGSFNDPLQHRSSLGFPMPQNPYLPSHQQNYTQPMDTSTYAGQSATVQGNDTARQIMGSLYDTPVAQQIISSNPNVGPEILHNLKSLMERFPQAQHDFAAFEEALATQATN